MNIAFVDALPLNQKGRYAHYLHRRLENSHWECCDFRSILEQHQEEWLDQVDLWHREFCKRGSELSPWWWFLEGGARLTPWYPYDLKPLFFALAAAYWARMHPGDILHLVGCPKEVKDYLEEWRGIRKQKNLAGSLRGQARIWARRVCNLKQFMGLAAKIALSYPGRPAVRRAALMVFSNTLSPEILAKQGDHFFGGMLESVPSLKKERTLWFYCLDIFRDKRAVRSIVEKKGYPCVFNFDFLNFFDLGKIFFIWLDLNRLYQKLRQRMPPVSAGGFTSLIFPARFFEACVQGRFPWVEAGIYFAAKRALSASGARTLLYPYEEKGLERALLRACRERGGVSTLGFAHAVYTQGHIYLKNRDEGIGNPPRPDRILAAGEAVRNWLLDWGRLPAPRVLTVGSPRFTPTAQVKSRSSNLDGKLRVLFLTGYGHEIGRLADWTAECPEMFEQCEVRVRKYPYDWRSEQEEGILRLKRLIPDCVVEVGDLERQLNWCDAAIFCSTSAGIHAMLRGRFCINAAVYDVFAVNPVQGKGTCSVLPFCRTAGQLRQALRHIRTMNLEQYRTAAKEQMDFAAQIYSPVNPEALECALALNKKEEGAAVPSLSV